ncbi:MAG: Oxidoreductase domain-containing protein [Candidatus Uhrbacteria bacterium GW2011_GWF2_39_13]|uniref:Oxidoreductase domain-containing protein n=1 Tax=Candidatus Uhrbacteria bacterium GW2011_GWF2_39_13 TaxID=1618995 RepID=A0A0G0MTH1_9BACT|nr:MAG: Oxidoreductase domain-containing protein [Candidatus Uhrbacteria bacterium GW2011_GWF2_39_13]
MNNKLKIGIIGLGGIGYSAHMKAFNEIENCEIAALCDIDPSKFERFRKEYGFNNFYTDYKSMLKKEALDAVVVGTSNDTHKDISIFALESGVAVLCEKPVSRNKNEAFEIQKVIDETSKKFMVGQCFRFRNQTEKIQEIIREDKLGEIYYCHGSYIRQRGIPGYGTWFTDKKRAGGGVILDLGVHLIDYVWFLLGKPAFKTVSAYTYGGIGKRLASGEMIGFKGSAWPPTYSGLEKNIFDVEEMASIFIRFKNNVAFHLEVAWAMNIDKASSGGAIFGSKGSVTLNPVIYTHEDKDNMVSEELPFKLEPSHRNQARKFIQFLNGEIDNPAPIDDALKIMHVLDAVYESARQKKEISINTK